MLKWFVRISNSKMQAANTFFFRKIDIRKLDIEGGLRKLPYAYLMSYWVEGSGYRIFFWKLDII